jgi:Flp pilus assembly protein TadB
MEGGRIPKRVLEWKPMGRRNRGRPRRRWIEDIEKDIQIMGIRGWRKLCKERAKWKKITEKAKTHSGNASKRRRILALTLLGLKIIYIKIVAIYVVNTFYVFYSVHCITIVCIHWLKLRKYFELLK